MISFKSRNPLITNTDRITRAANSVYPHVSQSKVAGSIEKQLLCMDNQALMTRRLQDLQIKNSVILNTLRFKMTSGMELLRNIIAALKNNHIGNCYEDARLAEIIAKINGQMNVYPMKIFLNRNRSGFDMKLEHVVSVLTDKTIEPNYKYVLKNKDAIILDPWLGITEFAGTYNEKLKNGYGHNFDYMPDSSFAMNMLAKTSKNLNDFKAKRKQECFNPLIKFFLHEDPAVTAEQAELLKNEYPELVLKDYKPVNLVI